MPVQVLRLYSFVDLLLQGKDEKQLVQYLKHAFMD